jgi:HEAT repeat protein
VLDALGWVSVGLAGATGLFVAVLVARRIFLARGERSHAESEERLRPFALALLDGEPAPVLSQHEAEVFASIVARYSAQIRGEAEREIARFFEGSGAVANSLEALHDRRAWRRAEAAYALGDMASTQAIPPLLEALSDSSRDVRGAAARSLGRLGADAAVVPLVRAIAHEEIPRGVAGQALLELGDATLPALRALTADEDPDLRETAVELLGILGSPADEAILVQRLRDSSAEVRARATRALGRLAAADAADAVRAALQDRIPFVRAAAARAIGEIGDRASAAALLELAAKDSYDPAQSAARALARVDARLLQDADRRRSGPHVAEFADRAAAGL